MGRRGPAPAPTKVKILRGEQHLNRLNLLEPTPPSEEPTMPDDMDDAAKVVWKRVLASMAGTGVIRAADTDVLRAYCEAVVTYTVMVNMLAKSGALLRGQKGELVKNPLHQIVRDNRDAVRLFARELGLSPSARAGLRIEPQHVNDSLARDIGLPPRLRAVGDGD